MQQDKTYRHHGPEVSGWFSEQLMTGKIPLTEVFVDVETKPSPTPITIISKNPKTTRKSDKQVQTDDASSLLTEEVKTAINSVISAVRRQTNAIESLESRIANLEASLKPVQDMAKTISSLNRSCAEMVAKYDLLVMTTGRATATAAATEAYWNEHGQAPPGPSLYEDDAIKAKLKDPNGKVPESVKQAYTNLDSTSALNEENFGRPYISAKDLKEIIYDHLPGFGTAFHQLVQVICKIGKDNNILDIIHAEFQASLAEGDSPQCALIQITKRIPTFQDASPPIVHIKSRGDIPKACQKSLRPVPPSPKIDRGWVCIFQFQDGKTLGLKI
uniref:Polymerase cofactor VP35 n=1 Tax=Sudan ebolavirus TaxID=186540 RepID=C4PK56_9MONO|nr:VP35 [Sudan ebolavirus]AGB56676.1 VP35 [Sudan ebolavirus]ALL26373.1 VP35 [Sudan ebolavirus]AWK96578.1 polymerase complex protein [Sudan ebolavirus]QDC12556.1 polymerase complex protein [Sudan ebolavirus]